MVRKSTSANADRPISARTSFVTRPSPTMSRIGEHVGVEFLHPLQQTDRVESSGRRGDLKRYVLGTSRGCWLK